ncbi:hypothetical protein CHH53_11935 [Terribacillus sp. 7520-G]|nr:hypothetical protein CHH53_11935 [Terribacillus sp. 7520-G]
MDQQIYEMKSSVDSDYKLIERYYQSQLPYATEDKCKDLVELEKKKILEIYLVKRYLCIHLLFILIFLLYLFLRC